MIDLVALHPRYQTPEYRWWRHALSRDRLPIHDEHPESGIYRWGNKAVEIWTDPDLKQQTCVVDGELYDMMLCRQNWVSISRDPITPQVYRQVIKTGKWPGDSEVAGRIDKAIQGRSDANHEATNRPPDGPELMISHLDELERDAERLIGLGAAKDQARADEAAKLADVIEKIEHEADELHRAAKAPHLEAGRAIDRLFFPVRDRAMALKRRLKGLVIAPFLKADQIAREKANAALVAEGADPVHITDKTAKAAGHTRTTSLRTTKRAVIDDYGVLLSHLASHPDVEITVQKIANTSARAGIALPGMHIETDKVAV